MCYKRKSEPAYDLATGTITTINQIDIFTKPVYFWVKSNNPRQNSWNTWVVFPSLPLHQVENRSSFPKLPLLNTLPQGGARGLHCNVHAQKIRKCSKFF